MNELMIAGVPAVLFVFGLVEFSKKMGLKGRTLTVLSLFLGVFIAIAVTLASGVPTDPSGWLTAVFIGLGYGLTASGAYDFIDKRTG